MTETEIGSVLAGKYKVLAKLGEGGMGAVFRAENLLTGRQVALKCLHPHVTASKDATERLMREARASASLSHPNVVDVYDVVSEGETLFLVMELLRGETLRAYLTRNPQPKMSEFIALMLPALAGVAAAHERGVIHRDLKPDNIFVAQLSGVSGPVVKVLDFGIAKLSVARGPTLTQTGVALGTPLYMSLEQLRGDKDIDQRADVYAFGVMLYEAVTGSLPYEAETLPELAIKVATTDPAPVKSLRPDVPTPLAKIIDWAVARDRKQRLPDIRTLQQELEVFAREHSFREQMTHREAPVPLLAAEKSGPAEPTKAPRPEPAAKGGARVPPPLPAEPDTLRARELVTAAPPRRTGARWAAVGAAIVGALGIGGWLLRQAPAEPGALDERGATTLSPSATSTTSAATGAPPADARPREQAPPGPSPLPAPGVRAQELVPGKDDKETLATDKPTPASLNAAAPRQTPAAAPESVKHPALPGSPATAQKVELPRAKDIAAPPPAAKPALASQVPAKPLTNPSPLPAAINIKAPPATAQPAPAKKKSSLDLVGF